LASNDEVKGLIDSAIVQKGQPDEHNKHHKARHRRGLSRKPRPPKVLQSKCGQLFPPTRLLAGRIEAFVLNRDSATQPQASIRAQYAKGLADGAQIILASPHLLPKPKNQLLDIFFLGLEAEFDRRPSTAFLMNISLIYIIFLWCGCLRPDLSAYFVKSSIHCDPHSHGRIHPLRRAGFANQTLPCRPTNRAAWASVPSP
jgi:hypothetical protein